MTSRRFEHRATSRPLGADQAGRGLGSRDREGNPKGWRLKWPWQRARQPEHAGQAALPALEGSLAETGVAHVLRLLAGPQKSGRLAVESGRWTGEVWLAHG